MNKTLFRLTGTIITLQSLYLMFVVFPLVEQTFTYEVNSMLNSGIFIISIILLLVSGVGLLFLKRWAVVTLWISLIVPFAVSIISGNYLLALALSNSTNLITNITFAIFLTFEWRRSR